MIKSFKIFENNSKYEYNIGDIYRTGDFEERDRSPHIILGEGLFQTNYFAIDLLAFVGFSTNKIVEQSKKHMKYYIDENRAKMISIEDEFKNDPEYIASMYENMSNFKDIFNEYESEIVENTFKPLIKNVQKIWLEKIPELEMYLHSNKYNL